MDDSVADSGIAVVGMSCRLPGAGVDPESFWSALEKGEDGIRPIPSERWTHSNVFHPHPDAPGRTSASGGGFLASIFDFDADFFGISPREAESMDPQHRLLLELAYEAIERAGWLLSDLRGSPTGVYVGLSSYDNYHNVEDFGRSTYTATGSSPAMASNRISYHFDLRGPSLTLDTACSASLVALDLARRSLLDGQCEQALVGAVNVIQDPALMMAFSRLGMLSPDNRCYAFDARASGFVRSEGGVVFVLKPLQTALRDGDRVEAVVLDTALNQDGHSEGITVPNGQAQRALLDKLYSDDERRRRLFYVETHGTGTAAGDPVEARALSQLAQGRERLWIGSVKTNLGHLEAAAGAAGLLKAILALQKGRVPPHLHFQEPPPGLSLERLNLALPLQSVEIPEGSLVGVNSFGFGGTSGHAVLSAAPTGIGTEKTRSQTEQSLRTLPLSGRSPEAVLARAAQLASLLEQQEQGWEDIVYTAARRLSAHPYRLAVVGGSGSELGLQLRRAVEDRDYFRAVPDGRPVFLFCGQGSQWAGMAAHLWREHTVFGQVMESCRQLFQDLGGWCLKQVLEAPEASSQLHATTYAQPALFAVQVALARQWQSWGITPAAVVGHSVGEVAAAHVAGALSLEQGARVIYWRAKTMEAASMEGGMLALACSSQRAERYLRQFGDASLTISALNGPRSTVLSGPAASVQSFEDWLGRNRGEGIRSKRIPVGYAFHSALVDPVREPLLEALKSLRPGPTILPMVSTVHGDRVEGEKLGPDYWWQNVRRPVLFGPALDRLLDQGHRVFLEVGPHPVLTPGVLEAAEQRGLGVTCHLSQRRGEEQNRCLLGALGQAWCSGLAVDWEALYPHGRACLLPTYPWQRRTHRLSRHSRGRELAHSVPFRFLGWRRDVGLPLWSNLWDENLGGSLTPGLLLELAGEAVCARHGKAVAFALQEIGVSEGFQWEAPRERPLRLQTTLEDGGKLCVVYLSRQEEWEPVLKARVGSLPEPNEVEDGHDTETELTVLQDEAVLMSPDLLTEALGLCLDLEPDSLLLRPRRHALGEIDEFRFFRSPPSGPLTVGCRRHEMGGVVRYDLTLRGREGVFGQLKGIRWNSRQVAEAPRGLLCPHWEHFAVAGADVALQDPGPPGFHQLEAGGLLYLAAEGDPVSQMDQVRLRLSSGRTVKTLILVTRGAQAVEDGEAPCCHQASLLGFWRSLALEFSQVRVLMVDLPARPTHQDWQQVGAVLAQRREGEVAVRAGRLFTLRWKERETLPQEDWQLREDRTYLITGGPSGLAGDLARRLVERGARHIVMVSRRGGADPAAESLQEALEGAGARIRFLAQDVSRPWKFEAPALPVEGIFHLANQMDDALIANLDQERLEKVFRTKAEGARQLDQLSQEMPELRYFVLFSSVSSVLGAVGQANYAAANAYLDALAHRRRAAGLAALVVNWGPIAGVGYLARHPAIRKQLEKSGYSALRPDQCWEVLEKLVVETTGPPQQMVARADWSKLPRSSRLEQLQRSSRIAESEPRQGGDLLEALVAQASPILRLPDLARHTGRPLREMGLDSVMAVEFRNALERVLGMTVPLTQILSGPSLEELALSLETTPDALGEKELAHLSDEEVQEMLRQLESES